MFSIIIVAYNNARTLERCLDSLLKYTDNLEREIFVIDNNSQDNTKELFALDKYKMVNYICNQENIGYGRANNQGAALAQGKYLWFLNYDAYIDNNVLPAIKKVFDLNNKLAALSPLILNEENEVEEFFYSKFPSFLSIIKSKLSIKKKKADKKIYSNDIIYTDWISGASMMLKKDAFISANGFDRNYFMYFEDVDLCKSLKSLDYKVGIAPKIKVFHSKGLSLNDKPALRKKYYYKSQNYFFKKHYSKAHYYLMIIWRYIYLKLK